MTSTTEALPGVDADGVWAKQSRISVTGYVLIHLACLLTLFTGVNTTDLVLCFSMVFVRMFGITGGYHRYFAHRTYRTSRAFQFVLALIGCSSLQKGPLWWAGGHRRHHRYADQPGDMHSPKRGFWYAHQLWIFDPAWGPTEVDRIRDFARYPELVWMNQWHLVPTTAAAVLCYAIGGFSGLIWGFFVGTVVLLHLTYSINSLAHIWGTRRYETTDTSRNNWLLGILTLGEGWHNNHHHYMTSTRQGFFWWEIDVTYYILRGLAALGIVWDLREPPADVRSSGLTAR
jgi:stearoyl-CoA desaturase (delta-9 desaturase)